MISNRSFKLQPVNNINRTVTSQEMRASEGTVSVAVRLAGIFRITVQRSFIASASEVIFIPFFASVSSASCLLPGVLPITASEIRHIS